MAHGRGHTGASWRALRSADDVALCQWLETENDPDRRRDVRRVLLERWRPLLTRPARELCSRSSALEPCRFPDCDRGWCAAFVETVFDALVGREDCPGGTAIDAARAPDANQETLRQLVARTQARWEEVQRVRQRAMGLPQRVDAFLRQSPHRACFQAQLDAVLAATPEVRRLEIPTDLLVWAKALFFDACQLSNREIDHRRVARFVARHSAELHRALDTDEPMEAIGALVDAVDACFRTMNEHHCLICRSPGERLQVTRELLRRVAREASSDLLTVVDPALVTEDNCVEVAATCWQRLGGEPPWYDRYIAATRQANRTQETTDLSEKPDDADGAVPAIWVWEDEPEGRSDW
ncbi:MAG: hypothetical protein WHS89_12340 [Acidimicrobiales bacterium]